MNSLLHGSNSTVRQLSKSRAEQKAFYRFLINENVTEEELASCCCERTASLCAGKHLLVINDSSEINLSAQQAHLKSDSGIGVTGNNIAAGFFTHLGLVIDIEACQALGYSSMHLWHRSEDREDKRARDYNHLPIEQKESYKWLRCGLESKEALKEAASCTIVGDRESDIYELLSDLPDENTHVILRSRFNRQTAEGERLYSLLAQTEIRGSYTIKIDGDPRKQTKSRTAVMQVKYCEAWVTRPKEKPGKKNKADQVKVWIVEAREVGKTDGVCWRLITDHVIKNFTDALQIIEWYKMRWWIEEVFRLLKNKGYRIEDSQLESGWAIRKLTIMLLQTILRVMQMLVAYDSDEEQDAGITFTEDEIACLEKAGNREQGNTEKLKNRHKKGTLKWATWIVARLGGWSGYDSQRRPGPITLKNGLDKFQNIYLGWCIAMETFEKDVGTR
jgi:hypothetical protein